ncbi:Uncharacterised protein [Vibrio cholerae]|nr:Uncharacterised protein [Vibrio cholerae]
MIPNIRPTTIIFIFVISQIITINQRCSTIFPE